MADDEVHQKSLLFMGFEGKDTLACPTEMRSWVRSSARRRDREGSCYWPPRRGSCRPLGDVFLGGRIRGAVRRLRLFDRIEIFALEVLNQREFEHVLSDASRMMIGASAIRSSRGAPPAFAGDDLVFVVAPADDERLDDAVLDRMSTSSCRCSSKIVRG